MTRPSCSRQRGAVHGKSPVHMWYGGGGVRGRKCGVNGRQLLNRLSGWRWKRAWVVAGTGWLVMGAGRWETRRREDGVRRAPDRLAPGARWGRQEAR